MTRIKNCFRYIWKKVKNKDTQKAVKINKLGIMNSRALHPIVYHFALLEKQNIPKGAA
jgi:hypothetical protein